MIGNQENLHLVLKQSTKNLLKSETNCQVSGYVYGEESEVHLNNCTGRLVGF